MTNNMLSDVVASIVEAADEVRERTDLDAQDFGELLGYAEALSIIQDACDPDERKAIGLDFDIDKRYLCGN